MGDSTGPDGGLFEGYGSVDQERLLRVSRKYDPERLFQRLMPAGLRLGLWEELAVG